MKGDDVLYNKHGKLVYIDKDLARLYNELDGVRRVICHILDGEKVLGTSFGQVTKLKVERKKCFVYAV